MLIAKINDSVFFGVESKYLDEVNRYGVRGVLVDKNSNIALMKINGNKYYKLPGGNIDIAETPKQAIVRELMEETGYEAEIIEDLGWIEEHKNKRKFCFISHCFVAKTTSDVCDEEIRLNAEKNFGFQIEWMPLEKAQQIINNLLLECNDYQMKFMLKREQLILENAKKCLMRKDF